jgi:hypothetical protein
MQFTPSGTNAVSLRANTAFPGDNHGTDIAALDTSLISTGTIRIAAGNIIDFNNPLTVKPDVICY